MRSCLDLSAELARRGHEVTLVHRPQLDLGGCDLQGVTLQQASFRRYPADLARLARLLEQAGIQVLHSHMSAAHAYGVLLRAWRGIPSVATAHSRQLQLHWAFNDMVIAPSRVTAEYHHRVNLVPWRRLTVIPNFIEAARREVVTPERRAAARARLGLDPDALVIGSVGDLFSYKRPSDLVLAAGRLLEGPAPVELVLVGGDGDAAEARRLEAAARPHGARVRRLGRRSDVEQILPALDIYAMASRTEEMPIAVLEAMSAGLPVVGVEVGGMADLVRHGETGLLAPRGDIRRLEAHLQMLARDPAMRLRMAQAGRERALREFAPGPIVSRVEAVLEGAAARQRRAA